jgi:hypothetical protein
METLTKTGGNELMAKQTKAIAKRHPAKTRYGAF